jgi:hypothetical protein
LLGLPIVFIIWRTDAWLWRTTLHLWRFRTTRAGGVILHYAPELEGLWDFPSFLRCCQREMDELQPRFGMRPRRTSVYLMSSDREVSSLIGRDVGGFAIYQSHAILLSAECRTWMGEALRHELTHLFTGRRSWQAPPLLSEGMSVWLQATYGGWPVDVGARAWVEDGRVSLAWTMNLRSFHKEPWRRGCYLMSGSFVGFLIRHHGWVKVRKLYRWCDGSFFGAKFRYCFGVSLQEAESRWREGLLASDDTRLPHGRGLPRS